MSASTESTANHARPPIWPAWFAGLTGLILAAPVFIVWVDGSLQLAQRNRENLSLQHTGIPISAGWLPMAGLIGIVLYVAAFIGQHRAKQTQLDLRQRVFCFADALVLIYAGLQILALGFGFLTSENSPGGRGILLCAQTIYPLAAYAAVRGIWLYWANSQANSKTDSLKQTTKTHPVLWVMRFYVIGIFIWLIAYSTQTIIEGGSTYRLSSITDHVGPLFNYKAKRFFPLAVMSCALISHVMMATAGKRNQFADRLIFGILAFSCATYLGLFHARTALLCWCLFVAIEGFICLIKRHWTRLGWLACTVCLWITASGVLYATAPQLMEFRSLDRSLRTLGFSLPTSTENKQSTQTASQPKSKPAKQTASSTKPNTTTSTTTNNKTITSPKPKQQATPQTTPNANPKPPTQPRAIKPTSPPNNNNNNQAQAPVNPITQKPAEDNYQKLLNTGDNKRITRVKQAIGMTFQSVFGTAYSTVQREDKRTWVHPSESGYLDLGVRAGILSPLTILALLGVLLWPKRTLYPLNPTQQSLKQVAWSLGICLIAFGNIWINILTESYLGPIAWGCLGVLASLQTVATTSNK